MSAYLIVLCILIVENYLNSKKIHRKKNTLEMNPRRNTFFFTKSYAFYNTWLNNKNKKVGGGVCTKTWTITN